MHIKSMFSTKKRIAAVALTGALLVGASGVAAAFFTTSGGGTGSGTVGTDTALVIHQDTITYSNPLPADNALLPGTSATVTFTVDNPSSGQQQLGTISVSSISTDGAHAGCDTATHPTWFTTGTDVVNTDYAPGNGQAVSGNLTITFNDLSVSQDVCKGAPLTFHYSA